MRRRAWTCGLLALLLCLSLSACRARPQGDALSMTAPLPEPTAESGEMFLGERREPVRRDLTLYYLTSDGLELVPVPRAFYAEDDLALARLAAEALFTSPGGGMLPIGPTETQVRAVERSGGLYTVDLSVDARSAQGDQELYLMYAAIAATLSEIEGAEGVNVLIGGQSESVYRLPVGILSSSTDAVVSTLAQRQAESDRFLSGDPASRGSIQRQALLYFPAASGGLYLPELRQLTFANESYAAVLLEALQAGPEGSGGCVSPIAPGLDTLEDAPNSAITEWGTRVLELRFTAVADEYLRSAGLSREQFAASLTLTMCSFVPELDGVRVLIDGEPVAPAAPGTDAALGEDVHARRMYADSVGGLLTLFFAGEAGGLTAVQRVVPQLSAVSPMQALEQLFFGPLAGERCAAALPGGVSALDVLGVDAEDGVVRVNLSGGFYRQCQPLDEAGERRAVYAIVNTLCQLDGVNGVRLYVEGAAADELAESIFLRSALLYNPGIIED